jgi:hypothetical protein
MAESGRIRTSDTVARVTHGDAFALSRSATSALTAEGHVELDLMDPSDVGQRRFDEGNKDSLLHQHRPPENPLSIHLIAITPSGGLTQSGEKRRTSMSSICPVLKAGTNVRRLPQRLLYAL